MAENGNGINETSKRKSTAQDILEYLPDWLPGVGAVKESRKRIEGKSKAKKKRETPFGEYE